MALTIHQKPLYDTLHAGEKIIYTIKDLTAVTSYVKVKYIARVYVAKLTGNLGTTGNLGADSLVAVVKTNPNSAGVGVFDLSPILDNYVSPDFEGGRAAADPAAYPYWSSYKGTPYDTTPHDIHVIDNFCATQNATKYVRVIFNMEYATALANPVIETANYQTAEELLIFNGFLEHHEILKESSGNFGYNLAWNGYMMNGGDKFLTEAPAVQYIREDDYATIAFFNNFKQGAVPGDFKVGVTGNSVEEIQIQYYNNGSPTGSSIDIAISASEGAFTSVAPVEDCFHKITYFGVGTANQDNAGHVTPASWEYYTATAYDNGGVAISQPYYYYKQEDDCKGYETIRLCWVNKFGTWDYYNFTQKSIRTFSRQAVSYQSMDGTWNADKFKLQGYRGGKKIFKSRATELITINTNFITDEEAVWLEGLFVSNNVYILNKNSNDAANQGLVRKYIEPVIVASEEMERRTTANNGKKQYTLTISKSKQRKTHRT